MALIPGTNVSAKIVPFDTDDSFATHDSIYGRGGLREVANLTERDGITLDRQRVGMLVYVESNNTYYQLLSTGEPPTFGVFSSEVSGASGSASSFLELTDTPDSYIGQESSVPIVSGGQLVFQGMLTGKFDLNTNNDVYLVSDSRINSDGVVVSSVLTPGISSTIYAHNISNLQDGSFNVILSDIPSVSGYQIHWVAYGSATA